jgi:hypothetical protein
VSGWGGAREGGVWLKGDSKKAEVREKTGGGGLGGQPGEDDLG